MEFIYSFLFAGIVCLIGQIILDNTKLLPGHITSLFTFVAFAVAPFNLLKGVLVSLIVALIYKKISPILKQRRG